MTSGRRGRRDNGLIAAEYAAVDDVDPRVGEHLLDVLEVDGIAAYLTPSADLHPITRTTTMPARPTDRLFVDRRHVETARELLRRLSTESPGPVPATTGSQAAGAASQEQASQEVDAAWASIVAGYDTEVAEPARAWPEAEDVSRDGVDSEPEAPRPARTELVKSDYAERSLLDGLDTFGADLPDDDQEGYTPPPPPPLPRPSGVVVVAVLGIVGGFILFLWPGALPISDELSMVLGLGAIIAGFVALIWRLRPGDDEDEDPDPENGAVV